MKLNLRTAALAGAIEASAKKDIRYYLNGVMLDLINEHELVVVATDGIIMFVSHEDTDWIIGTEQAFKINVPREAVEAAIKGAGAQVELRVVTVEDEALYSLNGISFKPIEGTFPDYTRITDKLPSYADAVLGHFDINLLLRAFKSVGKSEGDKSLLAPTLFQNAEETAVVQGTRDRTMCVIMPRRVTGKGRAAKGFTAWVQPLTRLAQAA